MQQLNRDQLKNVHGGERKPSAMITGAVWGAVFGAVLGIPAGPAGIISGAFYGALGGVGTSIAKEGGDGLVQITNGTGY